MHGNRRECEALVQERGGAVQGSITKKLDYLVFGTYVTDSWKHQSFGNKIMRAVELRDSGQSRLAIVGEDHWVNALGFL